MVNISLPMPKFEQPELAKLNAGSPIQASQEAVAGATAEHNNAIQNLGGPMTGGSVVVENPPAFVSAGGINPKGVYADLLQAGNQAVVDATYDGASQFPATKVGGRKTKKRYNGRKKHRTLRKHRRAVRRSRGVRHTRR